MTGCATPSAASLLWLYASAASLRELPACAAQHSHTFAHALGVQLSVLVSKQSYL